MNPLTLTRTASGIMEPRDNYVEIFRWLHASFGAPGERWHTATTVSAEQVDHTLVFVNNEDRVLYLLTWA